MYNTDKDLAPGTTEGSVDTEDSSQDSTLQWLLDMDMSDPEERLFSVEQDEYTDVGLSEYELAVASRPMTRGRADADSLSGYVGEEIVISSVDQGSDIYAPISAEPSADDSSEAISDETMAIDYSRRSGSEPGEGNGASAEGVDILGLSEDDDMGEKFLVIKRVRHGESGPTGTGDGATGNTPAPEGAAGEEPTADASFVPDEAPVLRLVNAPGAVAGANGEVANEDHPVLSGNEHEAVEDSAAATGEDVFGYVASVTPPAGDEAFDNYLLDGEQLDSSAADFSQLDVEPLAAGLEVDLDIPIDYHPDFRDLEGFDDKTVAAVTPLVPQLMDEIFDSVQARLAGLGLASDTVRAEIMLGSQPEMVDQLLADGFEPAVAICDSPPAALQQLRQVEVDAIFLRLTHKASGQSWNRLFAEEFVVPPEEGIEVPGAEPGTAIADADPLGVLDEDTLSTADLDGGQWQGGDADIDAVFDDFGAPGADADDRESPAAAAPVADTEDREDEQPLQVFEENLFADDSLGELEGTAERPSEDIDALFDSLGQTLVDGDEICGLDVDEFAAAGEQPTPSAPAPGGQAAAEEAEVKEYEHPAAAAQLSSIPEGIDFARADAVDADVFPDFLDAFIEEGSSEMEKLEDAIGAWERDVAAESAYAVVCRILHTIKGIAKGVGLQRYGTLIHNFETLLDALPRPEQGAEADYFRVVNAWLDAAVRGIDHIQNHRTDVASEFPQQSGDAAPAAAGEGAAAADDTPEAGDSTTAPAVAQPEGQRSRKLADEGARVLAAQQSVRITSDKLDHLLNLTNQAQQLGVRTAQSTARGKRASAEMHSRLASVRAHIAGIADRALRSVTASGNRSSTELDALEMDQYTELQEAANILREGVEDLVDLVDFASRQNAQVEALLKQQTTVISTIGSSIRAARVVPVSRLVPGLRRIIRTVSVDLSKDVNFRVLNELGTLDRDDYARCQTILEHMVRNALDHGIEAAEDRVAAGKPATGTVTIDIRKAGADAVITLSDDGRGIDPEAMRDSACRKGLDVDVDALSDEEAVRLIFHKGFSTASTVSQISGRGVGMDIVLSELQEMGGDIQIESTVGQGTAFHIRIPSSITVNGALLVTAGEDSYAIPLGGLVAVEQVPAEEFFAAVESNGMLSVAGMDCEPAYLSTLCRTGHSLDAKTWRGSVPVLVAGSPERYMAIAVDDVEEALELVIRSLGVQFATVPGVAGAATTADGLAVVALDLNLLVASVGAGDHSPVGLGAGQDDSLLVMVVDDSRTQRMVTTSQLEPLGVETVTAENGGVAIDLLNTAERLPDIILLDVEMPVKDGIQTLREIRKSVRYGHIPVIMVTSRTGLKHRALAQEAGCNGYMGKPFNFRMLVGQIDELTGHRLQLS